ncbi:MAG: hypothetical protein ACFB9M_00370 [Myxococcota bacterium]
MNASWAYDKDAGTLTITGSGANIGLSNRTNVAELSTPNDAPDSIVYTVDPVDANNVTSIIETGTGSGVWWQYRLTKNQE